MFSLQSVNKIIFRRFLLHNVDRILNHFGSLCVEKRNQFTYISRRTLGFYVLHCILPTTSSGYDLSYLGRSTWYVVICLKTSGNVRQKLVSVKSWALLSLLLVHLLLKQEIFFQFDSIFFTTLTYFGLALSFRLAYAIFQNDIPT